MAKQDDPNYGAEQATGKSNCQIQETTPETKTTATTINSNDQQPEESTTENNNEQLLKTTDETQTQQKLTETTQVTDNRKKTCADYLSDPVGTISAWVKQPIAFTIKLGKNIIFFNKEFIGF